MKNKKYGGSRPVVRPDDKRLNKKENKHRKRLISLPPSVDDLLTDWATKTGNKISPTIAQLVLDFIKAEDKK